MSGPPAKSAEARARRNKVAGAAKLSVVVDHEIPEMPPAEDWLVPPMGLESDHPTEWSKAVQRWWNDIWSSPMSNEFHDSDIHGLYLACFYLQQTLNPYIPFKDRLAASKAYETSVRNYGLTPMSRRSLQWEIERVEAAQAQGKKRRSRDLPAESEPAVPAADPRDDDDGDLENPFDRSPEFHSA
ncbi:terminase small subunit [Rhodococcus phage MacGully]|nr:terminase small subunit [Rhodococcus phage MacGully]